MKSLAYQLMFVSLVACMQQLIAETRVITYSVTICKDDEMDQETWDALEHAAQEKRDESAVQRMHKLHDILFARSNKNHTPYVTIKMGDGRCTDCCTKKGVCTCAQVYKGLCPCSTFEKRACSGSCCR